jgi:MFS family permease
MLPVAHRRTPTCDDRSVQLEGIDPSEPHTETRSSSTTSLVVTLALVALAAGYGQFGATSALGDVAKSFGTLGSQSTFTARAGLSGSTLSLGLDLLRLASLGALPLASFADRAGRRTVLFACAGIGLLVTASASLSPGYWWFVAIFALARPLLSAASALAAVMTTELTTAARRVTALAIVTAGSAVGAGLSAVVHGIVRGPDAFRILFATAVLPAVLAFVLVRRLPESRGRARSAVVPRLGTVPREMWGRLGIVMGVTAAIGAISGPANGFAFVYGERILKLSPGFVSTVVVLSAVPGLIGLLVGRRIADRRGRRLALAVGVFAFGAASVLAYSGGSDAFVAGYIVGVFAGGIFGPPAAAVATESFPAAERATAGGWIVVASVIGALAGLSVFGPVFDATGSSLDAGLAAFLPALPVLWGRLRMTETLGAALS